MRNKRRKFLIDRPVQFGLVTRIVGHWVFFLMAAATGLPLLRTILLGDIATPLPQRAAEAGFDAMILVALFLLLLPYFIYDTFRISNRFAGPMYRFRSAISALARGEQVPPVKLREGDFWQDVAQELNALQARIDDDKRRTHEDACSEPQREEPVAV